MFKAKVWYPHKSRFLDSFDSVFDYCLDIRNGKLIYNLYDLVNEDTEVPEYYNYKGYLICLYSGKIDKNKVEIYQYDLVKVNDEIYEVTYFNGAFALINSDGDFYEYMCNLCDRGGKIYEIIGNKLFKDSKGE